MSTRMALTLFAIVSAITMTGSAIASDWKKINLSTSGGVQVDINYQLNQRCMRYTKDGRADTTLMLAQPVYFDVFGAEDAQDIEIAIYSYKQDMIPHGGQPAPIARAYEHFDRILKLRKARDGHFYVNAGSIATKESSSSAYTEFRIFQKIQIRVNDSLLIDPISGSSEFEISMYERIGCLQ